MGIAVSYAGGAGGAFDGVEGVAFAWAQNSSSRATGADSHLEDAIDPAFDECVVLFGSGAGVFEGEYFAAVGECRFEFLRRACLLCGWNHI